MELSINTQTDSVHDIKEAIKLLQTILANRGAVFDNSGNNTLFNKFETTSSISRLDRKIINSKIKQENTVKKNEETSNYAPLDIFNSEEKTNIVSNDSFSQKEKQKVDNNSFNLLNDIFGKTNSSSFKHIDNDDVEIKEPKIEIIPF